MKCKLAQLILPLLILGIGLSAFLPTGSEKILLPLGGNSWLSVKRDGAEKITNEGWKNWQDTKAVFSSYIKVTQAGAFQVSAPISVPEGESVIQCTINGERKKITVSGTAKKEYALGVWNVPAGYVKIDIQGVSRTGTVFAEMNELLVSGSATEGQAYYVKDNDGNYFYWGRRGPSVHINYDIAAAGNEIEWFYNEIKVPEGSDPVGSYFMANGFKEGYFGMQVNSPTERRILFSVWSPFTTNDPKQIPDDKKIRLLKKGENVHTGEFGNEGSGGQSYLKYNWKAGETCKFLLHASPSQNNYTTYSAYFYASDVKKWLLIASFDRPQTTTYLTRLHSFLENFDPSMGNVTRKAFYQNQWIRSKNGDWTPLTKMVFTGDATAQKGYRVDYAGGEENGAFFLSNGGFFNNNTTLKSSFEHKPASVKPEIDFSGLQ